MQRGAVAQLGERRVRNAKVVGSIPIRSTIFAPGIEIVDVLEHIPLVRLVVFSVRQNRQRGQP